MTDYRSVEVLQVFKESEHVADLRRLPKGCEFRYTREYLASGRPPIALHLPISAQGLQVEGLANLPTYFAGILPEGVMYMAVRKLIGSAGDDLFAVLAATGADAIGDITVRVPGEAKPEKRLSLDEAADHIQDLLGPKRTVGPEFIAAISGVQPKLSIGELVRSARKARYIAKFDSPDVPNLVRNEFAFTNLARLCRIPVPGMRLMSGALVCKRFDRIWDPSTRAIRMLHLEDMLQVMDLYPNSKYSVDYVRLMEAMAGIGVSKATLLDALRLYVFSYLIGNGDLHAKNVSLVFDSEDGQWRLSPAYDVVSTLPYVGLIAGAQEMALPLTDGVSGSYKLADFVQVGSSFAIPAAATEEMGRRIAKKVRAFIARAASSAVEPDVMKVIASRACSLLE